MRNRLIASAAVAVALAAAVSAQKTVVVLDPTVAVPERETPLKATYQSEIDRVALPRLKAKYESDICPVELDLAGEASGSFTRKGAEQKIAFFQVCQTGNGLGIVALVVTENGKVISIYGSESGWSLDIGALPDINANGLDEFTLSYGGGMHQGQGGVGVDIMEFTGSAPKGIGWFKAEEFMDTEAVNVWKVTAKPGPTPVFYKQKYASVEGGKWRRTGANSVFKLGKAYGNFEVVK